MKKGVDYPGIGVCFICHDGKGNILMHRRTDKCRDNHWCWDCGGGGVKHGERLEDALVREVKEEYATKPLAYEFLGFRELFESPEFGKVHWLMFDYKVLVDPEQVSLGEPEKADKLGWYTFNSLPSPLHVAVTETLNLRRKHFEL